MGAQKGFEPAVVNQPFMHTPGKRAFDLVITFGATSVVSTWGNSFVAATVRNSPGNYTLTLPRPYRKFVGLRHGWLKAAAAEAVLTPVVLTDSSATDNGSGQATIVLSIRSTAGTETDPANGDVLSLELSFSNDALCDGYVG